MLLDSQIIAIFAAMAKAGRPAISAGTPKDARDLTRASRPALGPGPQMAEVRELTIPTRAGSIAARLLLPKAQVSGLVGYFHGCGWVVGELDDYDSMARTLTARSNCALLMPDCRLAPEHPFPAALEDTEDAILCASQRIEVLAGALVPFVVVGDSAGGNLATVAVCALAQRGDMQWFFSHYAPPDRHQDPRISPLRQPALAGMPLTVVITAECGILRDEGETYAQRLAAAGVQVVARRIAGLPPRLHPLAQHGRRRGRGDYRDRGRSRPPLRRHPITRRPFQ